MSKYNQVFLISFPPPLTSLSPTGGGDADGCEGGLGFDQWSGQHVQSSRFVDWERDYR